ncbi:uncharacterized protein BXZ73DRAFT_105305 [Epithele typhae]|uniref:uncharacterized protein n=1 Tax=Epithele typhae TaxID=378194 RepID=UPI0020084669|nr:uncharacterized protein BXZ73DRAFT_105305 [Epithele typhae]KAH9918180.1 hypothetical protein BXZ73DRAFT_105305 [Epithele typhae]
MTALHAHLHTPIAADDYNAALNHSARDPEGVLEICRTDDLTDRGMLWGLRKVSSGEGKEGTHVIPSNAQVLTVTR